MVQLSFGGKFRDPGELDKDILRQLYGIECRHWLTPATESDTGPVRLRSLIDQLQQTTGQQVVVLVDEYDKPILDMLEDPELALVHRDSLQGLYGILKDCARYLRFVFVTGISRYSRVSRFSGFNHLNDIREPLLITPMSPDRSGIDKNPQELTSIDPNRPGFVPKKGSVPQTGTCSGRFPRFRTH